MTLFVFWRTFVKHARRMSSLSHTHPDKIPNQKKNTGTSRTWQTYIVSVTYTSGQNTKPKKKYRHKSNMTDICRVCHIHIQTKYQIKKKIQTQVERDRHMSCLSYKHPVKTPKPKKITDTSRTWQTCVVYVIYVSDKFLCVGIKGCLFVIMVWYISDITTSVRNSRQVSDRTLHIDIFDTHRVKLKMCTDTRANCLQTRQLFVGYVLPIQIYITPFIMT
jgi:hypothetical protein